MIKQFVPKGNNILVILSDADSTTDGGIVIPASIEEIPNKGIVEAFGKGRLINSVLTPPDVEIGEVVIFRKNAGTSIEVDGKKCLILQEMDILGSCKDDSEK